MRGFRLHSVPAPEARVHTSGIVFGVMPNVATSHELDAAQAPTDHGHFAWAHVLLVIVAALFGCLVIFESESFLGFAINGDTLHLALTVWDYSAHDYAREGFSMSRVPSIVPDIVVYGAVQLATGSWRMASLAYGGLSLLGLAIAGGCIVREIAGCSWRAATQAFLLLALLVLMLELPITATSEHMHIFLPNNHGGPFILALAALSVAWAWLQRPGPGKLLLLFALVAAGVLSDLLFVVSCVGPTAIALAYAVLRRRIALRTAGPILACLALGTITARGLDVFLVKDGLYSIDWAAAPVHLHAFLAGVRDVATAAPLTAVLAYGLPISVFLAFPPLARARGPAPGSLDAVEYWWVLSAASVLATLLVTPLVYEGTWHYRYMMPLLWWPIIWTAAAVVRLSGSARRSAITAALAGVTVVLGYVYLSPGLRTPALLALHHPLEACLLEGQRSTGLKAGLGDYWHARYVEASSNWRLQIDQIEPDGSGIWWSNDRFWYTHDVHDGSHPPDYNYIVMPGLDERAIKAHYGEPDRTLDCGGSAIWVYDDVAAFRHALVRASPSLYATFLDSSEGIDRICIPADRFLSHAHTTVAEELPPLEGPLEARAEMPGDGSPQTWGPAFGLPAGHWTIALHYSLTSDAPGSDRWDVSAGWGNKTLHKAALAPTDDVRHGTVQAALDLDAPADGVEIRSFLAGTGTVAIYGAELARAGAAAAGDCSK
ncbi:MAG TPA: hypothetical protein VJN67_17555 [Stellaceae bacterium]|nr:hypothetical protein [Stellaceae bacterium]